MGLIEKIMAVPEGELLLALTLLALFVVAMKAVLGTYYRRTGRPKWKFARGIGWKDYEQPIGTHAKVTRRVCRDGVVGTVSAQKDGGGLNSVFVHFKWAAGAQSSLPSRCKKGH